jgi:membrane protease YdiL (CAAX protease family)
MQTIKKNFIFIILILAPSGYFLSFFQFTADGTLSQVLVLIILYPTAEELFFRGIVQPVIKKYLSFEFFSISISNVITSLFFATTHLIYHSPLDALLTFFPSLAFGYCQDRYSDIRFPIGLHSYYNLLYFFFI